MDKVSVKVVTDTGQSTAISRRGLPLMVILLARFLNAIITGHTEKKLKIIDRSQKPGTFFVKLCSRLPEWRSATDDFWLFPVDHWSLGAPGHGKRPINSIPLSRFLPSLFQQRNPWRIEKSAPWGVKGAQRANCHIGHANIHTAHRSVICWGRFARAYRTKSM